MTFYVSQNDFNLSAFAIKANVEGQTKVNGMWFKKKEKRMCVSLV